MRHIHDWERCINCYESGRNGTITHKRTCPDYVRIDIKTTKATTVRLSALLGGLR